MRHHDERVGGVESDADEIESWRVHLMNDSTQLRTFVCRSLTVAVLKHSALSPTPTRSKVGGFIR